MQNFRRRTTNRRGFTLLEMMIVVAIIGLLAAIAIPNFIRYQARSRRSEAFANLAGLARAQKSLAAERNVFLDSLLPYPEDAMYGGLGTTKMPWDGDAQMAYDQSGWRPEGDVFYSYGSFTNLTDGACCVTCWTAVAYGDVDGVPPVGTVHYVHAPNGLTPCTEPVLGRGTPTDPGGQPVYDAVAAYFQNEY